MYTDRNNFFFIYQDGWKQIVMPNGEVLNVTYCDDGCIIKVEGDLNKAVEKLNRFKNHQIIDIYCDSNTISTSDYFEGASIRGETINGTFYPKIYIETTAFNNNYITSIVEGRDGIQYENSCPECIGKGLPFYECSHCDKRGTVLTYNATG